MRRSSNRRLDHFDAWYQLVASYCHRDLSFLSDKLPAVAGLASVMQANYQGTYGAGLWKEDLQIGLVWYIECHEQDSNGTTNAPARSLSEDYIAPSLSWASIAKGKIAFCDHEENGRDLPSEGLQTIDWDIDYAPGSLAPFGEVKSGTLTVRGYLCKASLIPCWDKWSYEGPNHRHHNARWRGHAADPDNGQPFGDVALDSFRTYNTLYRAFEGAATDLESSMHCDYSTNRYYYKCRSCTSTQTRRAQPETLWYMSKAQPIWTMLCLVREKYGHRQLVALVLTPCDDGNRTFRRIGLLFVDNEHAFKNWMEPGELHKCFQTVQIV
ncbi:hypothetical protein IFR05_006074 [Cadophora sp. M221]|nr:hypothetical protein IFR05_006074 [Cadophora sp. M221]